MQKNDILTRAISTGVLTNRVFVSFCVCLKFACFAESTIIGFQPKTKTHKKIVLKANPRLC